MFNTYYYCIYNINIKTFHRMVPYSAIKKFLLSVKSIVQEDEKAYFLLNKCMKILSDILSKFEKLDEKVNEIKVKEKKNNKKRGGYGKIKKDDDNNQEDVVEEEEEKEEDNKDIINENGKRPIYEMVESSTKKNIFDNVLKGYYPVNSGISTIAQRETNISKRLRAEELQGYETMIDEVNEFINDFFK